MAKPNMQLRIVEAANPSNVLGALNSGAVPIDNAWHLISSSSLGKINPNGISRVKIQLLNMEANGVGNDFAIDDINVYQVPKSCPQELVKTVVIPSGQEFKASVLSQTNVTCKGSSTGKVTFKLENLRGGRYNISLNGGTISSSVTNSTYEIAGLTKGTHRVVFTYTSPVIGAPTCVVSKTITITEPAELTLTATVVEPAMCSNAHLAKVQVTATGGTGAYI